MMAPAIANESELYFERGGPVQRSVQRFARSIGLELTIPVRIVGFLLITWVPLLLFALVEGRALAASPKESLLLDFGTYARFFLAVPLLIVAEIIVGPRLREAGRQFVQGGLVPPEEYAAFDRAIARAARRRESAVADFTILAVAIIGSWMLTPETLYGEGLGTWRSPFRGTAEGGGLSFTGLWYHSIAVPVLQFIWYRWLWRLLVWAGFLWDVSGLELKLVGTHADQAGGLEFLGTAHTFFGIFACGLSAVLSAEVAFLVVFEKVDIATFKWPFVALLLIVQVFFLGPLLVFVPTLVRARLAWLRDYSLLVDRYNRSFHEKWVTGTAPATEPLLGSSDIQSLADLGNSFRYVHEMKPLPFNLRVIVRLAILTALPCLPLFLLVMPLEKLLELLTKVLV
jgi:hypothetical protein